MSQAIALAENNQVHASTFSGSLKEEGCQAVGLLNGFEKRHHANSNHDIQNYPLRTAARAFSFIGVATLVYSAALLAIALQSGIVQF
jgi:hypothetical protein